MRRLVAVALVGLMVAGCSPAETESITTASSSVITTLPEEPTTEVTTATSVEQTTTEAVTTSTTVTEESTTTSEEPTTTTTTTTTTVKEVRVVKSDLSKVIADRGLEWKVDPEWIEGTDNGSSEDFFYYPPTNDSAMIMLQLISIDPDDYVSEEDYDSAFTSYLDGFSNSESISVETVRHIKDKNGNYAREFDFTLLSDGDVHIGMGSMAIQGENVVVILGSNDTSEDYSQVIKDIMDTVEVHHEESDVLEKFEFEGFGDDVITFDPFVRPAVIVVRGNADEHHFAVWAHSPTDSDLLVNTTESYFGIHPDTLNGTNELEITATGGWKVAILDWTATPLLALEEPYEGTGDSILFMVGIDYDKPVTVTIEGNSGGSHFAVKEYLFLMEGGWNYADLLVNTVEPYSGSVRSRRGNVLQVTAEGSWTVEISQ